MPLFSTIRRLSQSALWKLGFHEVLPDRPSTLMVEPTNVCNLRCPACPTGARTLNRPPRAMAFEEFRRILDQALDPPGYLRHVTLFNYGEPFLCPDLLKMVRYASDRRLRTFTSTNGHFFGSDAVAEEVVASGLSELVVCLDGADQETIARYRKNARLDDILAGIRRVVEARHRARATHPVIELQYIVMKHNQHQAERLRAIARELAVDRFIEKTVGIHAGDPNFQQLAADLLPDDLSQSRYVRRPDGAFALKGAPPRACEYVYSTLVVNSNGDAVPCCYDVRSEFILGNLYAEPLDDIWRGEKFRRLRRRIAEQREALPLCRHCPEGRGNILQRESVGEGKRT